MLLTRSQSIVIAVGTISLFFVVGSVLVRNQEAPHLAAISTAALQNITQTDARAVSSSGSSTASAPATVLLNHFQRSEVREGRKLWEVEGEQAQLFPGDSAVRVKDARLIIYGKGDDVIRLRADLATLHLDGQSLSKAELHGAVKVVRNDEVTVTTDDANYDAIAGSVLAPGLVQVQSEGIDVSGVGVTVWTASKNVEFHSQVHTVVKPKTNSKPGDPPNA